MSVPYDAATLAELAAHTELFGGVSINAVHLSHQVGHQVPLGKFADDLVTGAEKFHAQVHRATSTMEDIEDVATTMATALLAVAVYCRRQR